MLFAQLLFFKDQHELFDCVALYKRATVSESLRLPLQKSDHGRFAHVALSLTKNKQLAQKTDERIPNPAHMNYSYLHSWALLR